MKSLLSKFIVLYVFLFCFSVCSQDFQYFNSKNEIKFKGLFDVPPYGNIEAWNCGIIPIEIFITIKNNLVEGEIINKYSEFNSYIPNSKCTKYHSGKISGFLDQNKKFSQVFVKHPTNANNLFGLYRIDGSIQEPKFIFKRPDWFKYKEFEFTRINKNKEPLILAEEKEASIFNHNSPKITITSVNVKNKQANIKGKVENYSENIELSINNQKVNIMKNGFFENNIFVPKNGIEVALIARSNSGLISREIIFLDRTIEDKNINIKFAKLNPLKFQGRKNKNALALIIGISKYDNAPEAKYADRDANYFYDYSQMA